MFDGLVDAAAEAEGEGFEFHGGFAAGGDDGLAQAEALSFAEALNELADGAEFAEEAELAEDEGVGVERAAGVGGGDGGGDRGIGGGFGEFDPPHHVDEDVLVDETHAGVFFEDGDDHGDAGGVSAGDFAFGLAEAGICDEGLDFDE